MAGKKDDREGVEGNNAGDVDQKISDGCQQRPFEAVCWDGVLQITNGEGRSVCGDPLELNVVGFGGRGREGVC